MSSSIGSQIAAGEDQCVDAARDCLGVFMLENGAQRRTVSYCQLLPGGTGSLIDRGTNTTQHAFG